MHMLSQKMLFPLLAYAGAGPCCLNRRTLTGYEEQELTPLQCCNLYLLHDSFFVDGCTVELLEVDIHHLACGYDHTCLVWHCNILLLSCSEQEALVSSMVTISSVVFQNRGNIVYTHIVAQTHTLARKNLLQVLYMTCQTTTRPSWVQPYQLPQYLSISHRLITKANRQYSIMNGCTYTRVGMHLAELSVMRTTWTLVVSWYCCVATFGFTSNHNADLTTYQFSRLFKDCNSPAKYIYVLLQHETSASCTHAVGDLCYYRKIGGLAKPACHNQGEIDQPIYELSIPFLRSSYIQIQFESCWYVAVAVRVRLVQSSTINTSCMQPWCCLYNLVH